MKEGREGRGGKKEEVEVEERHQGEGGWEERRERGGYGRHRSEQPQREKKKIEGDNVGRNV